MINITTEDLKIVKEILQNGLMPETKVWVFGSRATGKAKKFSDLDLIVDAGAKLNNQQYVNLKFAFEESDLPYKVDVVDRHNISDTFYEHIKNNQILLDFNDNV